MPEAALSDEQILGLDDASAEVAESPESTSLGDEQPAGELQPENESNQQATESESSKATTATKEVAEQRADQKGHDALSELFPQGESQAKETLAKAAELDRFDKGYFGEDATARAETLLELYTLNPPAFQEAMRVGMQLLKQNAAAEFSSLADSLIGDALQGTDLWRALEHIYATSTQRPEEVPALLNRLAGFFTRYGLGPQVESAAGSGPPQEFTAATAEVINNFIDADIQSALPAEFKAVQGDLQPELIKAINFEIYDALRSDTNLGLQYNNALRGGTTKESGVAAANLVASKLRSVIVPGAVKRVLQQYGSILQPKQAATPAQPKVAPKPAQANSENPRSLAEARAKGLNLRDILKLVETEQQAPGASPLGQDEANTLSDMDILSSNRIGQKRGTWRPEDIFEKLVATGG
jgi:hypothetical protein